MIEKPHCLKCEELLQVTAVGYDGIKLSCGCAGFGNRVYVDFSQFHSAPQSWVYTKDVGFGKGGLEYLGDYYGVPDPEIYD